MKLPRCVFPFLRIDLINKMITLSVDPLSGFDCTLILFEFDFVDKHKHKQMIPLSVIPLSGFDCNLILFEFAAVDEHGPVDGVEEDEEGGHEEDEGTINVRGLQILPDRMLLQDWDRARGRLSSSIVVVQTS